MDKVEKEIVKHVKNCEQCRVYRENIKACVSLSRSIERVPIRKLKSWYYDHMRVCPLCVEAKAHIKKHVVEVLNIPDEEIEI